MCVSVPPRILFVCVPTLTSVKVHSAAVTSFSLGNQALFIAQQGESPASPIPLLYSHCQKPPLYLFILRYTNPSHRHVRAKTWPCWNKLKGQIRHILQTYSPMDSHLSSATNYKRQEIPYSPEYKTHSCGRHPNIQSQIYKKKHYSD